MPQATLKLVAQLAGVGPATVSRVVNGSENVAAADLALRFGKIGEEVGLLGIGRCVLDKRYEIPALRPPSLMIADALGEPFAAPSVPAVQEASV